MFVCYAPVRNYVSFSPQGKLASKSLLVPRGSSKALSDKPDNKRKRFGETLKNVQAVLEQYGCAQQCGAELEAVSARIQAIK